MNGGKNFSLGAGSWGRGCSGASSSRRVRGRGAGTGRRGSASAAPGTRRGALRPQGEPGAQGTALGSPQRAEPEGPVAVPTPGGGKRGAGVSARSRLRRAESLRSAGGSGAGAAPAGLLLRGRAWAGRSGERAPSPGAAAAAEGASERAAGSGAAARRRSRRGGCGAGALPAWGGAAGAASRPLLRGSCCCCCCWERCSTPEVSGCRGALCPRGGPRYRPGAAHLPAPARRGAQPRGRRRRGSLGGGPRSPRRPLPPLGAGRRARALFPWGGRAGCLRACRARRVGTAAAPQQECSRGPLKGAARLRRGSPQPRATCPGRHGGWGGRFPQNSGGGAGGRLGAERGRARSEARRGKKLGSAVAPPPAKRSSSSCAAVPCFPSAPGGGETIQTLLGIVYKELGGFGGRGAETRTSLLSLRSSGSCRGISPILSLLRFSEITGSVSSGAADLLHRSAGIASGAQSHGVWVSSNIISLLTRDLIAGSFEEGAKAAREG